MYSRERGLHISWVKFDINGIKKSLVSSYISNHALIFGSTIVSIYEHTLAWWWCLLSKLYNL